MAIHDYVLDNQNGKQFRQDLNNALQAIVSNNSSLTEPNPTFPNMLWVDTTSKLLKLRNGDNTSWIILGDISGSNMGLILALASAATPSLAFQGDLDTGIYSPGANLLALVAGATEYLRIGGSNGVEFKDSGAVKMPAGTTGQRPGTPVDGMIRFNSDGSKFEGYAGGIWKDVGGGGGGGSLEWVEDLDAPMPDTEFNNRIYMFASGLGQKLYALIKVPSSYASGTQIKMKLGFYSPDSSGNVLVQTVSTLVRAGTDAMSSTTNQRISSNAAVTLGAGTVNIPQTVTFDLTDTAGKINGKSVSAGDYIKIQLTRGTDTAVSDVKVPVYGAEVTFT